MNNGKLIFVRHGLTDWSIQQLRLGSSDIPLNQDGIGQANWVGEYLRRFKVDEIWHSDMQRTRETATIIASRTENPPIYSDERLRERDHGKFEGTPSQTLEGVDATGHLSKEEAEANNVESPVIHWERTTAAYKELHKKCFGKTIVIVSHSGSIRMMLAYALGLNMVDRRKVWIDCGSVSVVRVGETFDQLLLLNLIPSE